MTNIFKRMFLIGLIILLSCSLPMLGGKPKIEKVTPTLRTLSGKEAKELVERIPTILTEALGPAISDVKIEGLNIENLDLGLQELSNPLLQRLFPKTSFYSFQKLYISGEERPRVLIAAVSNKLYHMPSDFNRLLLEHNLEVNDKNIIEFAKAFVIIALEGKEITFLEGKRIKEYDEYWAVEMAVQIKCKIGEGDVQTWKFSRPRDGQFGVAQIFINKKYGQAYQFKRVER